jgi:phosphatidylserine/phosphatidylglycerophosphate/cardiolipin synthase-like enzyme
MNEILTDKTFIKRATELVKEARQSVYISTFKAEIAHSKQGMELIPFWEQCLTLAKQQKDVRLLINWNEKRHSVPKTNLLVWRKFKAAGAAVKCLQNNRCCHSKLLIIDKKIAIIGSHNLAVKSCTSNFENSILTTDDITVRTLVNVYKYVFNRGKNL